MALYAYGTFLIGICLIAFLGFIVSYSASYMIAIGQKTDLDMGVNDAETDLVYASFTSIFGYLSVFMFIILGLWLIVYIQRKGGQIYGEI